MSTTATIPAAPTEPVGPDVLTRHIAVTTEAFTLRGAGGIHTFAIQAGQVTWAGMRGQTQIDALGPLLPRDNGKIVGALVEHPTAKVGDVLPMTEVATLIQAAKTKQAAVAGQRAAREAHAQAARNIAAKELADSPPLTAAERSALRKLLSAKSGG